MNNSMTLTWLVGVIIVLSLKLWIFYEQFYKSHLWDRLSVNMEPSDPWERIIIFVNLIMYSAIRKENIMNQTMEYDEAYKLYRAMWQKRLGKPIPQKEKNFTSPQNPKPALSSAAAFADDDSDSI